MVLILPSLDEKYPLHDLGAFTLRPESDQYWRSFCWEHDPRGLIWYYFPTPTRWISCGLTNAWSVIVIVPVRVPYVVGSRST